MSRSVRRNSKFKFHQGKRTSWKKSKQFVNRYNRRRVRYSLRKGDEFLPIEWRLSRWDWDYCKEYIPLESLWEGSLRK
jgi:hypothetical protein